MKYQKLNQNTFKSIPYKKIPYGSTLNAGDILLKGI